MMKDCLSIEINYCVTAGLFDYYFIKAMFFCRAETSIHNSEMEDYENVRPEIPGLVETERTKKGKKKSNASSKKTLSLQNFLQEDSSQGSSVGSQDVDPMESHFAKLNLDEEVEQTISFVFYITLIRHFQELIVMESCHSFIHDMLKHMGPTNAMDPRLQQEINNFPPEAKVRKK